ncbi:MAG: glutamate synthase subunit beta [Planctomycetota bacterium]|jgi:glutamate synthase (NADPH/NADH) small chain|nr:glutamate synthase subunit beta [Planctomycetota bacterium]
MAKYRNAAERIGDFRPVEMRLAPEELIGEMKRCQDCGIPFCHAAGCTLMNAIPEINAQALAGRWPMALATLLDASPFPEFTARVCPGLCEGSCVQGMHGAPVQCRQIEKEVIECGFSMGLVQPRIPAYRTGVGVGVVGSGPAGLAAAWRLNQAGLNVTVYERDARPGGFLRYGIPDFKLEKEVLDRRVDMLAIEGVVFECGVEAGVDVSGRLLKKRHGLIMLAGGARKKRDLAVPDRSLNGIHFATDFLGAVNRRVSGEAQDFPAAMDPRGKRVVVIGGGDTGSDCVGSSWRLGARDVLQVEIMPEPPRERAEGNPWPEWPRIRRDSSSHEEGGERRWSVATLEYLPAENDLARVGGLRCAEVDWSGDGAGSGPTVRDGSERIVQTDMVYLALGFTGPEDNPIFADLGVARGADGRLAVDGDGRAGAGVYAAGDAATGPSLVVRAIADGLRVAETLLVDHLDYYNQFASRQALAGVLSHA